MNHPNPTPTPKGSCCEKCKAHSAREGVIGTPWCGKMGNCPCHSPKVSQKIEEKMQEFVAKDFLTHPCPECDGFGKHIDLSNTANSRPCSTCNGNGNHGDGYNQLCTFIRTALTDIWNSAIEEAGKVVDDFGCKEPRCEDGHYPLGVNEDDSVEWGGCPNCTKDGARLEPFAALDQSRTAISNLLIK